MIVGRLLFLSRAWVSCYVWIWGISKGEGWDLVYEVNAVCLHSAIGFLMVLCILNIRT